MLKQEFCLFDFDRTITQHDSFRLLMALRLKQEPWRMVLLLFFLPVFLMTAALRLDKRHAKSATLWCLTFGLQEQECYALLRTILVRAVGSGQTPSGRFWLSEGIARIHDLQKAGYQIVVCTASAEEWVRPLLESVDVHVDFLVGTQIGYRWKGLCVVSPNCYHAEKVRRLEAILSYGTVTETYSDHPSDIPLLNLGSQAFLVNPKGKHLAKFERGLQVPYRLLRWE